LPFRPLIAAAPRSAASGTRPGRRRPGPAGPPRGVARWLDEIALFVLPVRGPVATRAPLRTHPMVCLRQLTRSGSAAAPPRRGRLKPPV